MGRQVSVYVSVGQGMISSLLNCLMLVRIQPEMPIDYVLVIQWIEILPSKQKVGGSSPSEDAK